MTTLSVSTGSAAAEQRPRPSLIFRPFDGSAADYERYVTLNNANVPAAQYTVDSLRHEDATWNHARFYRLRLMARAGGEAGDGSDGYGAGGDGPDDVVGFGEILHITHQFHPDKYWLELCVDPALHRRGYGSAIWEHMLSLLRERGAIAVRTATRDDLPHSLEFLAHRGFDEVRRAWESRLDVATFDPAPFAGAEERVRGQGITFTTLGEELARDRGGALRRSYDLHELLNHDVPSEDPYTPRPFEDWVKRSIEGPDFLPDGFLIAKHGDEWVAESSLWREDAAPEALHQGLTGVRREHRGKGIALALKLRGIAYARARGYREIRTTNDTTNRPMLRINEAMGFAKQPAWVILQKALSPAG